MGAQNGSYRMIGNQLYLLKPRDYVVTIAHDAVAGTTAQGIINVDPSSPFLMTDRFMTDTNDPSLAAPGLQGQYENLISVQDSSNGYNWSNDFVPRSAFARDRTRGYKLPDDVLIQSNTKLSITIKNPAAAAAAGSTTLTLQGYTLYPV